MRAFLAAVALTSMFALQAHAQQQANYTQAQLNALKNHNSAATFTSDRVKSQIYNRSVPQYNFSNVNRGLFRGAMNGQGQGRSKPFSHVSQGPSSSPYLGMLADNPFTSTTSNYFNHVRPQIEQQKANEKLMMQNAKMQHQLNEIAAKPPYDITGSEDRAPTGHASVYQNNGGVYANPGGYYPQVQIRSVRGQK